jgi:hypothetical protein
MAGDNFQVVADKNGIDEAEPLNRFCDLADLPT